MSEWMNELANHLWQTTAFVMVVWLASLALRRNAARVRYALWLAASIKFLLPFSLLIALGGMLPRPQRVVAAPTVYATVDEVAQPFSEIEFAPPAPAPVPTLKQRIEARLPAALATLWLCGVVTVMAVWCGGLWRVARTLRRARRTERGREAEMLRRLESAQGRKRQVHLLLSRDRMEPGLFGIFRPVLIWPERLSGHLDDEHVEAVMIHELAHAQRRDNLTAALHMLVEAIFWFHPLVWWMERRMIEERERACDEAVVAMGSTPGVYAESLLRAVRFCVESPLRCVAGITGADLVSRVRSIMQPQLQRMGLWRKLALTAVILAAVGGPVAFGVLRMIPVYGQVMKPTGPPISYDIVLIKPSQEGANGASTEGEQTHYLVTAKLLVQFAYATFNPARQISLDVVGGPDWINDEVFDILAKMDSQAWTAQQNLSRTQRREQRQLMEQSLLADRFKLKMHVETRDRPVYALTIAKGMKLTPSKDTSGGAHVDPNPGSMAPEDLKRGLIVHRSGRNFEMTVKGMTLDAFADALTSQKEAHGLMVANQTGLTDAYDFTLRWGPEEPSSSDTGDVDEAPLFTAIQQQLGLKLTEAKGPAEVVVIDHIEKPLFDNAPVRTAIQAEYAHIVPVAMAQPTTTIYLPADEMTKAAQLQAGGNIDAAIQIYREIIKSVPSGPLAAQAQFHLSQAYLQKGDLQGATREFQLLATKYPAYKDVLASMAAQTTHASVEPQRGVLIDGKFNHFLTGIQLAIPAGYTFNGCGMSSGNGEQAYLHSESQPDVDVWMRPVVEPVDGLREGLRQKMINKPSERGEGWKERPESARERTFSGNPGISVVADYTLNGQPWVEYLIWIDTGKTHTQFYGQAPATQLAALEKSVDTVANSSVVP